MSKGQVANSKATSTEQSVVSTKKKAISQQSTGDWDQLADVYANFTKGVAFQAAKTVLDFADEIAPWSGAKAILDNGCGPGPIVERLLDERPVPADCRLIASDLNDGMIKQVQLMKERKLTEKPGSPWSRLEVIPQDALDLNKIEDGSLGHITAGWVYFLTGDPDTGLREAFRALKPNGVLSLSSWHGNQWMEICNVLVEHHPSKSIPIIPEDWKTADSVKGNLEKAGFVDVRSEFVPVEFHFQTVADIVDFFMQKFPMISNQLNDLSANEVATLREEMIERGKGFCSTEPGKLTGVSISAAGRKP